MSFNTRLNVSVAIAAFAVSLVTPATAVVTGDKAARMHHRHYARAGATYRPRLLPDDRTLPYRPEYGFLPRVPPDAVRMPGYTFVPGVGILGASCDLPTSACSNQYRDIQ
jgi:hypothetical protein